MQANNDVAIDCNGPVKQAIHQSEYEEGYSSTEIDKDCGIADIEVEFESRVKRASVDILQVLSDTTNVTLSNASRLAWKRYEDQTAIKRHRPCSRILVESFIRDPLQDLMIPWSQMQTRGDSDNFQKSINGNIESPLKAPWKKWWNEETIFSWAKQSLIEWNPITNESGTPRNRKQGKVDWSVKEDSASALSSPYLDGSYVNVGKTSSNEELLLKKEPATQPTVQGPERGSLFAKTLKSVRSRADLKGHQNELSPLPTPKVFTDEYRNELRPSSARTQKTIGLGISGLYIPDFSATQKPEAAQSKIENRLDDHPPCLPEIAVDVSFSEGESVCWSSQSSPANESFGSAFSQLSCLSESEALLEERDLEERDTARPSEPSTPSSVSSYEHMRSLIRPLFDDDDDHTPTSPPPVTGDFPSVSSRFSVDEPKSVLKDFQKSIFNRTHKGNQHRRTTEKENDKDATFSTYPQRPQYQAHGYNNQRHPDHPFPWTTYNIWCYHCTEKTCFRCGNRCCFLAQLLDLALSGCMAATKNSLEFSPSVSPVSPVTPVPPISPTSSTKATNPKTPTSLEAKKQVTRAIRAIMASYPTGGKDAIDMFLKCTSCERTVCSMCCGVCPEELCEDLQCKECKTDPWARCDWHW